MQRLQHQHNAAEPMNGMNSSKMDSLGLLKSSLRDFIQEKMMNTVFLFQSCSNQKSTLMIKSLVLIIVKSHQTKALLSSRVDKQSRVSTIKYGLLNIE